MADVTDFAGYRAQTTQLLQQVAAEQITAVCDALQKTYEAGATVWAVGNGGSASTASHFIEDLAKLMWHPPSGRRLKCHALTEATAFITALANDDGYERIFDIQLAIQSAPQDALICISGSGQSPNVLRAAEYGQAHGLQVIALTGFDGGRLGQLTPLHIHVASDNMGMLEGIHLMLLDFISKELRYRAYGTPHAHR